MESILDLIQKQLDGDTLSRISRELGADERTTGTAASAAVSAILGGLARNAKSDDGARALSAALAKDHDGSALDDVPGQLREAPQGPGDGILRHVMGSRRSAVEGGLSQATGLDRSSMGKLMTMLAPVVMGALGRTRRQDNLDARALAGLLGQESRELARREGTSLGILGRVMDADGDGDVDVSDLIKRGGGLLDRFLGR